MKKRGHLPKNLRSFTEKNEVIYLNLIFSRKVLKILKIISNIHNTNICDITKDLFKDIYFINFKEIFC